MSTRGIDAPLFGLTAVALFLGALSDAVVLLGLSAIVGSVLVARTLPAGGLVPALAVGLLWSNAAVVTSQQIGAPEIAALAPQVIMVVLLVARMIVGRGWLIVTPAFRVLLLYGAALFLSGLTALVVDPVMDRYLTFLIEGPLLWLLVVNLVTDRRGLERALTALVVVAGFLGALTSFQYATETFTTDYAGFAQLDGDEADLLRTQPEYTPRLSGSTGEKNRFAQLLLVTVPIAVALAHRQRSWSSTVYLGAAVCMVGGIAASGSRGAALGLVVTAVLLATLRVISVRAIVSIVVAATVVLVSVPDYRERVFSTVGVIQGIDDGGEEVDGSTLSRITENLAALDMFVDHPLLGVGPGGYPFQYEEYAEPIGLNVRDARREPHNLYLGISSELGALGLLTFLAVAAVVLRDLWRARAAARGVDDELEALAAALAISVVAYLFTGVFLHLSFERYLWLLLAMADVAARVIRRRCETGGSTSVDGPGDLSVSVP